MSTEVLGIRDVHHSYGDTVALDGVSFSVEEGSFVALLGPNGSGKTTLFRIVSTLLSPQRGSALVCGTDVALRPNEVRRQLGVVFQHVALDADLTIRENLRHSAALYGMPGDEARAAAEESLQALGLEVRADDRVKNLSGGLARRADLARVLMHRPGLLLLDEPTVGLDPSSRRDFWLAVDDLRAQRGTTVVVATHLLEEADQCDHLIIMNEGQVVAEGSPDSLKAHLAGETLWIEAPDPHELAELIQARFGADARVVDAAVHIAHPQAHQLLARIYEAAPEHILSATVRRPTLEDVFMVHTGHGLAGRPSTAELSARNPLVPST